MKFSPVPQYYTHAPAAHVKYFLDSTIKCYILNV